MSSQLLGALIAVGLGLWAYSDAKRLQARGVRVGRFSPVAWGCSVALVAIFFGVLYLRQRSRALSAANSPAHPGYSGDRAPESRSSTAGAGSAPEATVRDPHCGGCGHELPEYAVSFCPKCGKPL